MGSHHYDVFLSHNSADKPAVEELAKRLVEENIGPGWTNGTLSPETPGRKESKKLWIAVQLALSLWGPAVSALGRMRRCELPLIGVFVKVSSVLFRFSFPADKETNGVAWRTFW